MKFKTFRLLMIALLLLVGGGATALVVTQCKPAPSPWAEARTEPQPLVPPVTPQGPVTPAQPGGPAQVGSPAQPGDHPLRAMDRAILARVEQNIGSDKVKDALRGQPYKVNLYRDAGQPKVNRLKIDLDRDDRDDEKWTFEPDGRVKRQVSPGDDEQYTVEYRLEGEGWRLKR